MNVILLCLIFWIPVHAVFGHEDPVVLGLVLSMLVVSVKSCRYDYLLLYLFQHCIVMGFAWICV